MGATLAGETVRAARIHRYGPPEALRVEDVDPPGPVRPKDLRVAVHAASVNPVDVKIRSGGQRALIHLRLPWTLGLDFAGEVLEVGPRVEGFAVGDRVYGSPTHRRPGTYAEELLVDASQAARIPGRLSYAQAASLPLVALTAWDAFVVKGRLRAGQRVLVHAGAGGVGTFAIQLAKHLGAGFVATTASPRNHALVTSLGADLAIDYRSQRFEEVLADDPVDLVLDAIGGETRRRSLAVLRRGGVIATLIGGFPAATLKHGPVLGPALALSELTAITVGAYLRHRVRVEHVLRSPDGRILDRLRPALASGALVPVLDRTYPLEEIVEAHRYSETGRARGKIVVALRDGG
jgi:alcohol dehydrogenase